MENTDHSIANLFLSIFVLVGSLVLGQFLPALTLKKRLKKVLSLPENRQKRISAVLSNTANVGFIVLGMSVVVMLTVGLWVVEDNWERTEVLLFTMGVVMIESVVVMSGLMDRNNDSILVGLLKEATEEGTNGEVEDLVEVLLKSKLINSYGAAIDGMRHWGSPAMVKRLDQLSESHSLNFFGENKALKNKIRDSYKIVGVATSKSKLGTREVMAELGEELVFYKRLGLASSNPNPAVLDNFIGAGNRIHFPYQDLQQKVRAHFPNVFCKKCRTRAVVEAGESFEEVVCRNCKEFKHLSLGIKTVVGFVGEGEDMEVVGTSIMVKLWNPNVQKVTYAEIDALKIQDSETQQLDWAVAAIIESMTNLRPGDKAKVKLFGELPRGISPNAKLQLEEIIEPPIVRLS